MSESLLLEPRTWTASSRIPQAGDDFLYTTSGERDLILDNNYNTVSITLTTASLNLSQFVLNLKPHKNTGDATLSDGFVLYIGALYWSQPVRSAADGTLTFLFKDVANIATIASGTSGTVVLQCGPCYSINLWVALAAGPPLSTSLVTARVAAWRM